MQLSFDLFLFDFDGLLVDSERLQYEAFKKNCADFGAEVLWGFEEYCGIAHVNASKLEEETLKTFPDLRKKIDSWQAFNNRKRACYLTMLSLGEMKLMPGVESFLLKLSALGKKMAVATNSPLAAVCKIKETHPILNTIPLWVTREDYQNPKPSADPYLKAIELSGCAEVMGIRIVGFEDSIRGIESLKAAKVQPVLIAFEKPSFLEGVLHFKSLADIL